MLRLVFVACNTHHDIHISQMKSVKMKTLQFMLHTRKCCSTTKMKLTDTRQMTSDNNHNGQRWSFKPQHKSEVAVFWLVQALVNGQRLCFHLLSSARNTYLSTQYLVLRYWHLDVTFLLVTCPIPVPHPPGSNSLSLFAWYISRHR
jgi:hypothetical protein